jgi:CUG-BP- and ETR3-like factor
MSEYTQEQLLELQQQLALERQNLDQQWEQLRQEREAFQNEMKSSGVEIKLFVGNLDPETTSEELEAIFAQYGSVKELHLLKDHTGASKRSAFVKYFAKASADAAVLALHEKVTDKNSPSRMVVRQARQNNQRQGGPGMSRFGAPAFPQVQAYGQQAYAQAAQAAQAYNPYMQPYAAQGMGGYDQSAAQSMYGQQAYGKTQTGVRPGSTHGPPNANLYINNIAKGVTEADLRTSFGEYGTIVSCTIFSDNGYGFVSYDNAQSAATAISCMNGVPMQGIPLAVSLKKASSRSRFAPY